MVLSARWALQPLVITRRHLRHVLPTVDRELEHWGRRAQEIPDPDLRRQALSSLTHKRFHCEGGSVFAAGINAGREHGEREELRIREALIRFIVALQTISDYLDNLCDRTQSLDPTDFRQMHQSMLDAIAPDRPPLGHYYRFHPNHDDGGYLDALVDTCRTVLSGFPRYQGVEEAVQRLIGLYVDLQVGKHIAPEKRVVTLKHWFASHEGDYPELKWWEFAAASGSTLAVFALVSGAAQLRPSLDAPEQLAECYFPWICGLHILLDYLIDQEEDRREGDLNFVSFYADEREIEARMGWILQRALESIQILRDRHLHLTVVEGLLGLYLSDPKVVAQGLQHTASTLLRRAGWRARLIHRYCRAWRRRSDELRKSALPGVERIQREKLTE